MERTTIRVEIDFESYIGHPYWPQREETISIEKDSGMNRQKSEEKRLTALKGELNKRGLSLDDYHRLKEEAARPFYRQDNDDPSSPIVIPRHQLAGAVVEALSKLPKNVRGQFDKDNFRHLCRMSDLVTTKTEADGIFDRYVKLETSNMRSRQQNPFIRDFTATGTIEIPTDVKVDAVQRLFSHAIEICGVGAARKMGYGRGMILNFE